MRRSEIFDTLAEKVCFVCEVSMNDVLSAHKSQELVDARMLMVQYLRRIGLSNDDIATIILKKTVYKDGRIPKDILKNKAKGIDRLFCNYSNRCMQSYAFGLMSIEIRDFCHDKYDSLYHIGMKQLPSR